MISKNKRINILIISLILTASIFFLSFFLSSSLDQIRINEIENSMQEYELQTISNTVKQDFYSTLKEENCKTLYNRIETLNQRKQEVGKSLKKYSGRSTFTEKKYDQLQRKYFLLQIKIYLLVKDSNPRCPKRLTPVLFFHDPDKSISERQGLILDEISDSYQNSAYILTFDTTYDKEPALKTLKEKLNITTAPTIIIGEEKYEGITYTGEIESAIGKSISPTDPYTKEYDMRFTLRATNTNITRYTQKIKELTKENHSNFAEGDLRLILGRLKNNKTITCKSLKYYDKVNTSLKEKALALETIASIGCQRNKEAFYKEASKKWEKLNNSFRAKINQKLSQGIKPEFKQESYQIPKNQKSTSKAETVKIGENQFNITNKTKIISQTDRVTRDWLSKQIQNPKNKKLLKVFSEKSRLNKSELLPNIGWHEGGRIKQIKNITNPTHKISTGTLAVKKDNEWYAPNEKGELMFKIPKDKLLYPTTRFLTERIAVIIDTHGINMLVKDAVKNNASIVIGCCDRPSKIKAASYLSKKGIKTICFTDKRLPNALNSNIKSLGSPPIKKSKNKAVIGDQPIKLQENQKITVMNVKNTSKFAISYYKTPTLYFKKLEKNIRLKTNYVNITSKGQTSKIIKKAEKTNSSTIAIRIYNKKDYKPVKNWLEKDKSNKAILFHSVSYPYGYKILKNYPEQTSFDDPRPKYTK